MAAKKKADPLKWWREARFGMFIHWGIYAVPAGKWKGKKVDYIGEWIQHNEKIPVAEYSKLAGQFNPVKFNARQWVKVAKDAGMKYLVITAKHHDGFAMYDSACSDYDIIDATPFKRDPMKALARECQKAGIKLCFYYSQDQDWHHPGGARNTWDYDPAEKDFAGYLREKVKPQLRELLTQYGAIGLIWFDTPTMISKPQSLDLKRLVHRLQPKCLVSGRVGHGVGDYGSLGDNMIPAGRVVGDWETPATLNDTWAFKTHDKNWKSVKKLLFLLVDLASKGVNYLLNVGPTEEGIIPQASVDRLREIGDWLKVNGESIYGAGPSPFASEFSWGRITQRRGKLYLHFYKWPRGKFTLFGLRNKVKRAYLLGDKRRKVEVSQSHDKGTDHHTLVLRVPGKKTDKHVSVLALEIRGALDAVGTTLQQPDGSVTLLPSAEAIRAPKTGRRMHLAADGRTVDWVSKSNSLSWEFLVSSPGEFRVRVVTAHWRRQPWKGGHKMRVSIGRQSLRKALRKDEVVKNPRSEHLPGVASEMGKVKIAKAGSCRLTLKAEEISARAPDGITLTEVQLIPV